MAKKKTKINKITNTKHKEFYSNYIKCKNASKSYMMAYPKATYETARVNGCRLLAKTNIQDALQEHYDSLWKEKEKEVGKTFDNLLKIANSDISDIVEYKDGVMKIKDFDKIDSTAIQQINQTIVDTKDGKRTNESVKLYDKTKSMNELLKVLGMIQEKISMKVVFDKESAEEIQEIFGEQITSQKNNK